MVSRNATGGRRARGVERERGVVGVGERAVEQRRRVGEEHDAPVALARGDRDRPGLRGQQRLRLAQLRPDAAAAEVDRRRRPSVSGAAPATARAAGRAAALGRRLGDDVAQPAGRAAAGDEPHPVAHARADRGAPPPGRRARARARRASRSPPPPPAARARARPRARRAAAARRRRRRPPARSRTRSPPGRPASARTTPARARSRRTATASTAASRSGWCVSRFTAAPPPTPSARRRRRSAAAGRRP